jgi:uncharacterized protein (DUF433 family)
LNNSAAERDEGELLELVVVRTGQHQFSDVVRDYPRRITYGGDGWASRVRLPSYKHAEVVVDPLIAFGLPLVVHGGARVEDLVDRFIAGDSVADIAYDFGVPPKEVEDVIRVDANSRLSSSSIEALDVATLPRRSTRTASLFTLWRRSMARRLDSGSRTNTGCVTPAPRVGSC